MLSRISAIFFCFSFLMSTVANAQDSFTTYSVEVDEMIEMVPVEGGNFVLGSSYGDSEQVEVQVDSFWMGKYEITWEQYKQFSADIMSSFREQDLLGEKALGIGADAVSLPSPPYVDMSFGMGTDGFPAISMTHYAASMFTKWLTAKTGDFYRLPTEAEWEYACRAGIDSNDENLESQAWFKENSASSYQKVGTKESNEFGLYDMPGNVAEWTADQFYGSYYDRVKEMGSEPVQNPWFQVIELYPRAVRGASWMDEESEVSCAKRRPSKPNWKRLDPQLPKSLWWHTSAQFLGFRVVRPIDQPSQKEMKKYWPVLIEDY